MSMFDDLMDIITLGGHTQLKKAKKKYDFAYNEYKSIHDKASILHKKITHEVESLGNTTKKSFTLIHKAFWLLRVGASNADLIASQGNIIPSDIEKHLPRTVHAIHKYSSAFSVTAGLGAGSALAMGSWALVSLVGTASTGTAIAGLTGVAATNATLAWFGGGALAAGGAGMAGGTLVLGGLFVVPLIVYSVWSSHSKSGKLKSKTKELKLEKVKLESKYSELLEVYAVVTAQHGKLQDAYEVFEGEYRCAYKLLLPLGVLSIIHCYIRHFFGGLFYSKKDEHVLVKLTESLECFSGVFSDGHH